MECNLLKNKNNDKLIKENDILDIKKEIKEINNKIDRIICLIQNKNTKELFIYKNDFDEGDCH